MEEEREKRDRTRTSSLTEGRRQLDNTASSIRCHCAGSAEGLIPKEKILLENRGENAV